MRATLLLVRLESEQEWTETASHMQERTGAALIGDPLPPRRPMLGRSGCFLLFGFGYLESMLSVHFKWPAARLERGRLC